jgi:hypothetical protein
METYRLTPRRFLSPGMLSLLQKFRLCVNLIAECSSAWPNDPCAGGMSEVQGTVTSSSELNFRIGYGTNGDFAMHPTAF